MEWENEIRWTLRWGMVKYAAPRVLRILGGLALAIAAAKGQII
jgi:hypothetical protein